ncbi:phosphatidylcholine and lysophosphatidylcholine phospholipase [Cladochytrium tenue]|nr:phosphatidylcholine and lysophosphatidylcholine phospholipase [Cladochytrium tenue]
MPPPLSPPPSSVSAISEALVGGSAGSTRTYDGFKRATQLRACLPVRFLAAHAAFLVTGGAAATSTHWYHQGLGHPIDMVSGTSIESFIEDHFAVTTKITHSRAEIHRSGYMWRYIRASMMLVGFMLPICDGDHMLVDGGYINNLPADVMRSLGASTIVAVDVSVADHTEPVTYGDYPSGWWPLLARFTPWAALYGPIPSQAEIQSRLAYVSSVKQLDDAKRLPGCAYLHPPVSPYGVMGFAPYKDIFQVGYRYGREAVRKWEADGSMREMFGIAKDRTADRRGSRRASI